MREDELYAPIIEALNKRFGLLGSCYFEDTHRGFSEELKDNLDTSSLFILKVEQTYPDLTGYIFEPNAFHIIVVEIKKEANIERYLPDKKVC